MRERGAADFHYRSYRRVTIGLSESHYRTIGESLSDYRSYRATIGPLSVFHYRTIGPGLNYAPHRHHTTRIQQCCMNVRSHTRATGQKQPPEHLGATCADHRHNTVPATSRAYASPRTPQPRYQIEHRVAARRRMSGLFMGSEMRSRNALPQREQQVSNKEALTAWDKRATIRPPSSVLPGI